MWVTRNLRHSNQLAFVVVSKVEWRDRATADVPVRCTWERPEGASGVHVLCWRSDGLCPGEDVPVE